MLRQRIKTLSLGEAPWPLFVHGPPGTGKTCAGLAVLDHAGGFYFTAGSLAEEVILAMKGQLRFPNTDRPVSTRDLWRELGQARLVVLDELGSRSRVSDHHYDCVKRLLDEREGRPLVALSNLDPEALRQLYDDRVVSRLAAGTVLALTGEDQRLRR